MSDRPALPRAVKRVLGPLAEILLRHGIPHAALVEWAKAAYVDAAERAGGVGGRKVSTSRISIVTGLTRKEVARLRSAPSEPATTDAATRYHRAARVVTGWIRAHDYTDDDGQPLELPLDGPAPSFATLVHGFAGDVPARAVLDELERVNAVESTPGGRLRLVVRAWIPQQGEDQQLEVLGNDVGGLLRTIAHNLEHDSEDALFQREVYYDNLPEEALPELRELTARHGQELLELLDRFLAMHDRDASGDVGGTGRKFAGIGVFYFEGDVDDSGEGTS